MIKTETEKSTAWREILRSFFGSDEKKEKVNDQEFLNWKEANKDVLKADRDISNLEKMLVQHIDEDKNSNKKPLGKIASKNKLPSQKDVLKGNEKIDVDREHDEIGG